jgi:hypothetical protein
VATLVDMTKVITPSREDLEARRAEILRRLDLTADEFAAKVTAGGLVGEEWAASAEIEEINYLLKGV